MHSHLSWPLPRTPEGTSLLYFTKWKVLQLAGPVTCVWCFGAWYKYMVRVKTLRSIMGCVWAMVKCFLLPGDNPIWFWYYILHMTISIRTLSILMFLSIVLNMIITIAVLYMAIHSSGSLSQIIQFVSYLIIGSWAVVSDTHITIIIRLSNSVSVISPMLVPGGSNIIMLHSIRIFWAWQSVGLGLSIRAMVGRWLCYRRVMAERARLVSKRIAALSQWIGVVICIRWSNRRDILFSAP